MKYLGALAVFGLMVVCHGEMNFPGEKTSMALLAEMFNPRIETGLQLRLYESRFKTNMNDYVDRMLKNASQYLLDNGFEPMKLPDIVKPFSFKDLVGIEWHGELDLNHGWLQDLSTIFRSGDVTVEYQDMKMLIKAQLGFKDLVFDYDFVAKFMDLSKKGEADGKAAGVLIAFSALVDLSNETIALQDFAISHVSDTEVEFTGMGTIGDFVLDAMTKVVIDVFDDEIIKAVETEARKAIEDALANMDIGDIIHGLSRL
ncbi:uncharacterized protein LOC124161558 isoform X1 [Ischnura elegans]|uniref:uncharacterized protein LOC124161558 isoform X1 n=2 Tax=Ischnura elegans TaxID=197161 RepID=UPI001ED8A8EA|nr:uncharacterized protein LOC124161558 isoform X1 [Ischnura elegans]